MDPIIAFYTHQGTDHQGRTLKQIWNFDDYQLEKTHDYIQWLFPTPLASKFNSNAPILTSESICQFIEDEEAIANLTVSSFIFQRFLKLDDEVPFWIKSKNGYDNHNCLRISRVIYCLNILELYNRANDFYSLISSIWIKNNPSPLYHWELAFNSTKEMHGSNILNESISSYLKDKS